MLLRVNRSIWNVINERENEWVVNRCLGKIHELKLLRLFTSSCTCWTRFSKAGSIVNVKSLYCNGQSPSQQLFYYTFMTERCVFWLRSRIPTLHGVCCIFIAVFNDVICCRGWAQYAFKHHLQWSTTLLSVHTFGMSQLGVSRRLLCIIFQILFFL